MKIPMLVIISPAYEMVMARCGDDGEFDVWTAPRDQPFGFTASEIVACIKRHFSGMEITFVLGRRADELFRKHYRPTLL